jgi:hypothetical protein
MAERFLPRGSTHEPGHSWGTIDFMIRVAPRMGDVLSPIAAVAGCQPYAPVGTPVELALS